MLGLRRLSDARHIGTQIHHRHEEEAVGHTQGLIYMV